MLSSTSCEIKGWTSEGSGGPIQEAWLPVTLPCMPSARVRSQIRSWFGHPLLRSGIMKCPGNAFWVYRSDHPGCRLADNYGNRRKSPMPLKRKLLHTAPARSNESAAAICAVIRRIPKGWVATYGQVAALAGLPRRARLVGRVLQELAPESNIPWHRGVNAKGE